MDDEIIICRCEEVTVGQIKQAIHEGAVDVTGIKRRTRAGMGLCQGRTCEKIVMRLLAQELGAPLEKIKPDTIRPPIVPVTFGALASNAND